MQQWHRRGVEETSHALGRVHAATAITIERYAAEVAVRLFVLS